jgi:hypothetical protein
MRERAAIHRLIQPDIGGLPGANTAPERFLALLTGGVDLDWRTLRLSPYPDSLTCPIDRRILIVAWSSLSA